MTIGWCQKGWLVALARLTMPLMITSRTTSPAVAMAATLACVLSGFSNVSSAAEEGAVRWAIALHGGAGSLPKPSNAKAAAPLEQSLRDALAAGVKILSRGGAALDAVEAVVVMLEDNPQFNAGKGAVFTRVGTHELDAAIMDGATLDGGAVAGVKRLKNPIRAARLVMEHSDHVLLAGQGADRFAIELGCQQVDQSYYFTNRRFRDLQILLRNSDLGEPAAPADRLEHPGNGSPAPPGHGTVGCVALDTQGNLAAATSTGGLTGKLPGRIGDTPICGAGTYANNRWCAVSATGIGEQFIRHSIAAKVAWLMEERQMAADDAVRYCLTEVLRPGDGGLIAVDRRGHVSMRATTGAMPRAVADSTGRFETAVTIRPSTSPSKKPRRR